MKTLMNTDTEKALKLEEKALSLRAALGVNAMDLARAIAELYPLLPWRIVTGKREPMPIDAYFRDILGIHRRTGVSLPYEARRFLVESVFDRDNEPGNVARLVSDLAAMTGWGERTINRDRAELGFAAPNRSSAQKSAQQEVARTRAEQNAEDGKLPAVVGDYIRRYRGNDTVLKQVASQAVDGIGNVSALAQVIAHATARLAEISKGTP